METVQVLQPLSLRDYLNILRRRKLSLFLPLFLITAAAIAIAGLLPPVYKSEATILIEREEVPENLVETTVTGLAGERVQEIAQRMLTNRNLWDIAERLDLWPKDRSPDDRQTIVQRMKDGISVEMVDVETAMPGSSRQAVMTVAFKIAFAAETPQTARKVARELSEVFLEENRQMRTTQVSEVSRFIDAEAARLSQLIGDLEEQLARFKQENQNVLPELSNINLRLFEQTEANLARTEESIRALRVQRNAIQAQIRVTDPYAPIMSSRAGVELGPVEKLQQLRAEYVAASARYSSDYPDLVKLRREISALESQLGVSGGNANQFAQLDSLRKQLDQARSRYSDDHPDVKRLKASVRTLEQQLHVRTSERSVSSMRQVTQAPTNPQYVSLQSQLDGIATTLQAEIEKREQLTSKLAELEQRLFETPVVERDQAALLRDYNNALERYRQVKDKQLQAKLAEQLELEDKGERLVLIDPANLPSLPESPNRPGIVLLGVFLAFSTGIGSASLAEYFDRAVRGVRGLTTAMMAPPLAVIPEIQTRADGSRRNRRRLLGVIVTLSVLLGSAAAVHFLIMPLPELLAAPEPSVGGAHLVEPRGDSPPPNL